MQAIVKAIALLRYWHYSEHKYLVAYYPLKGRLALCRT